MRSIYRAITALEQEMQKLHGININEGMLLCLLSENKSLTSGEIAEALGLKSYGEWAQKKYEKDMDELEIME